MFLDFFRNLLEIFFWIFFFRFFFFKFFHNFFESFFSNFFFRKNRAKNSKQIPKNSKKKFIKKFQTRQTRGCTVYTWVQTVCKNLVHKIRQRLTKCLATDWLRMAYLEWEPDRVSAVATSWPQRLPRFPPSPMQPLGYDHYRLLGHCVLDALSDQKTNPTNQLKRKLDAVVGRITDMDADRQEAAARNVRQRMR